MSFVPSIRPYATQPLSAIKRSIQPQQTSRLSASRDIARFGNHQPVEVPTTFKEKSILAFNHIFSKSGLIQDAAWGAGLSLVAAIIPPHAHALLMFPACFAVGAVTRGMKAFFNPKEVTELLNRSRG